jgi:peptide deformylase
MNRAIVPIDHPALRMHAREIAPEEIATPYITELIGDMKQLLASERLGVAIAAPQVGEAVRLFVVSGKVFLNDEKDEEEVSEKDIPPDQVFINPVILKLSQKKADMHEGCLSLPGIWGLVPRSIRVRISATDEHGKQVTRGTSGLLAHVFQHEIDHLDGIIYTDKAHDTYEEEMDPDTAPESV